MTFDDSKGVWKICPCCGGTSVEKDIIEHLCQNNLKKYLTLSNILRIFTYDK